MTFTWLRTFLILFLLAVLPACAEEPQTSSSLNGTVTWIYDGDTLKIEPHGTVRLVGIDTPEKNDSERDGFLERQGVSRTKQRQTYQAAKQFNIAQAKGKQVQLTLEDPPRDRHDRLLAYVYLPDGRLLNKILIEEGLAVVYRRFDFRLKAQFIAAETKARRDKQGIWGD